MQAPTHSSAVSTGRATGFGLSFTRSDVNTDASCNCVSGGGAGAEAGEGASAAGASAVETRGVSGGSGSATTALLMGAPAGAPIDKVVAAPEDPAGAATETIALAGGVSTCPPAPAIQGTIESAVARVPAWSPDRVFSTPDELKTQSPATTAPHNTSDAANWRRLNTRSSPRARVSSHAGIAGIRSGRLLDHDRFVRLRKAQTMIFLKTCCPNTTPSTAFSPQTAIRRTAATCCAGTASVGVPRGRRARLVLQLLLRAARQRQTCDWLAPGGVSESPLIFAGPQQRCAAATKS